MLLDPYKRPVSYLRVSVTDRCDFRCEYCMAENMTFLPKKDLLSLQEIERICVSFINLGTTKIRITGGEPLVRKNVMELFENLGSYIKKGKLKELTLTTNGSQLEKYADDLFRCGVKRVNVSVDTLKPELFSKLTRRGSLDKVLRGIYKAKEAGLKVKINTVALKETNETEIVDILKWAHSNNFDMTIIETMPLGEIDYDRTDQFLPLSKVKEKIEKNFTLTKSNHYTGGPSRYFDVKETMNRIGFITPLTHNFCELCNRVRLTCTGKLYMCLGQDDSADFVNAARSENWEQELRNSILEAISRKPKGHDFVIRRKQSPSVSRHMSVTGG
ncbi:MAG: GTP 3',8-cyclase MoaA [Pseudomonadota bacterium]|nr:GTP 3',8-cyclase MoaA [Pseudomonadota bacterium]